MQDDYRLIIMKKLLILFSLVALTFASCSSDDASSQDSFIGEWRYNKSFENGVEVELEECEDLVIFDIEPDGTFEIIDYTNFGNGCELDFPTPSTWENLGSGLYKIATYDIPNTIEVTFSGNTMTVQDVIEDVEYRDVFIRQ